jgi:hypothetical protein
MLFQQNLTEGVTDLLKRGGDVDGTSWAHVYIAPSADAVLHREARRRCLCEGEVKVPQK